MKKIQIHQVDVFTDQIFGGNPAAVVFDADNLSDEEMKNIAREMNLSETVFISKSSDPEVDFKFRYVTSGRVEVKFCGHATVGGLFELARAGKLEKQEVNIETGIGRVKMRLSKAKDNVEIIFRSPDVDLIKYRRQSDEFANLMGVSENFLTKNPIMLDRNLSYVYVEIDSLENLSKLNFDFERMGRNFSDDKIMLFCLFTRETINIDANLHARALAPLMGLTEDPVTGSMQAGLFTTAKRFGLIAEDITKIKVEQGHWVGRPGFVYVEQIADGIQVIGRAQHVFSTEMSF